MKKYISQYNHNKDMTTSALITMIVVQGVVTLITAYLFWRVLTTPPKPEPDSFSQNDDIPR